ncbi:MAG: hypothetical protein AAFW81_00725 [Pseudomonadota bacterium]
MFRLFQKSIALRLAALGAVILAGLGVGLSMYPDPLFPHEYRYGSFVVRSDRPIEPGWDAVLGDAKRRLATSALYDPDAVFRLYVCNAPWRLWFFTRNKQVGGFADTFMSRGIFLRESVAGENRIVPPGDSLADADARTLSYFIAHEATHILQSRAFGRLMSVRSPRWLVEGYADHIAKAGAFDAADNRRRLREGDALLTETAARRGLYRRYHLMVEHALAGADGSIHRLFADPPREGELLRALESGAPPDAPSR